MARYTGPKHKLARREGVNIIDKLSPSLQRRLNIPPGIHGRKGKRRVSEFGQQMREKQKAKAAYGILEKQFKRLVQKVGKQKGETGELLLGYLESRLDNVVYRLGFAKTRYHARQLVSHGHILVDEKKITIPSFQVKKDAIVSLSSNMQKNPGVIASLEEKRTVPTFLSLQGVAGKLIRLPKRDDVDVLFDTQMIIEYYSR